MSDKKVSPSGRADRAAARARSAVDRGRGLPHDEARRARPVGPEELPLADAVRDGVLRHRVHVVGLVPLRPRPLRGRGRAVLAAAGGPDDHRRDDHRQAGADPQEDLRPDARAEVGHLDGRLRLHRAASTAPTTSSRASTRSSRSTSTSPGCPPTPENLIHGLIELQKRIQSGELARHREAKTYVPIRVGTDPAGRVAPRLLEVRHGAGPRAGPRVPGDGRFGRGRGGRRESKP